MPENQNELIQCACGCGQTLWRYSLGRHHKERKYIHGHNAIKTKVATSCDYCRKPIEVPAHLMKRLKHHFCGIECTANFKNGQTTISCPQCGKSFSVPQNRLKRDQPVIYCSKECFQAAHVIETACAECGNPVRRWSAHAYKRGGKHIFCSRKCQHLYQAKNCRGPNHPRWKDDKPDDYIDYGPLWPPARLAALERDRHTCQHCGRSGKRQIDVHHLKPVRAFADPDDAHDLENLVTLCNGCHVVAEQESRRLYPKVPR